jgi:hypothetical protein
MPKKREPSNPKVVWVGSTPITPITDRERRETDKRIRKHHEKLRQRYIEVHKAPASAKTRFAGGFHVEALSLSE